LARSAFFLSVAAFPQPRPFATFLHVMQAIYGAHPVPTSLKELRACVFCKLIKTRKQFSDDGCDNCGAVDVEDNTSANFKGFVFRICLNFSKPFVSLGIPVLASLVVFCSS
jgi:hypothetical protein